MPSARSTRSTDTMEPGFACWSSGSPAARQTGSRAGELRSSQLGRRRSPPLVDVEPVQPPGVVAATAPAPSPRDRPRGCRCTYRGPRRSAPRASHDARPPSLPGARPGRRGGRARRPGQRRHPVGVEAPSGRPTHDRVRLPVRRPTAAATLVGPATRPAAGRRRGRRSASGSTRPGSARAEPVALLRRARTATRRRRRPARPAAATRRGDAALRRLLEVKTNGTSGNARRTASASGTARQFSCAHTTSGASSRTARRHSAVGSVRSAGSTAEVRHVPERQRPDRGVARARSPSTARCRECPRAASASTRSGLNASSPTRSTRRPSAAGSYGRDAEPGVAGDLVDVRAVGRGEPQRLAPPGTARGTR